MGVAAISTIWGVLKAAIWVLDWFGRGESAMDVYKLLPGFLSFLGNPAFSLVVLVVGFTILSWQAKSEPLPSSPKQIVHPTTKLPVSSERRIWPIIKLPVMMCIIAILVAIPIWACYKTPLRNFAFVQPLPKNVIPMPPPVIEVSVPNVNQDKSKANSVIPSVKVPAIPEKGAVAPPHPAQVISAPASIQIPANRVPIPASAPLTCPSPGTLAQGWIISLEQMERRGIGVTLPVENGPINFYIRDLSQGQNQFQQQNILHPLLVGKVHMSSGQFKGSQHHEAEALLEDVKSHVGSPAPLPYQSIEKSERFVSSLGNL
jgi:hypothetical protein